LESIEAVEDELRLGNKFVFVFCARWMIYPKAFLLSVLVSYTFFENALFSFLFALELILFKTYW
jgi:hypothetical protein